MKNIKKKRKTHFPFTDDFILLIHIQVQNQLTSYSSQPSGPEKHFSFYQIASIYILYFWLGLSHKQKKKSTMSSIKR